mmetsp:Transcript_2869/g.5983  ORF Transcript_2869/g.5983 Transcript_2869/m.5983 type:complete len:89 (-) Transcript_2869:376-642(-)
MALLFEAEAAASVRVIPVLKAPAEEPQDAHYGGCNERNQKIHFAGGSPVGLHRLVERHAEREEGGKLPKYEAELGTSGAAAGYQPWGQ